MSATISITTILSLLGLAIAYFYMKKVTAIPLDLGLEEKDGTRLKFSKDAGHKDTGHIGHIGYRMQDT